MMVVAKKLGLVSPSFILLVGDAFQLLLCLVNLVCIFAVRVLRLFVENKIKKIVWIASMQRQGFQPSFLEKNTRSIDLF
jgi:hypothetical protein